MWAIKHGPETIDDILLTNPVREEIRGWGGEKPLLLYGGYGVGKTLLTQVLADQLNLELIEVTDDNISNALAIASTASVFGGLKLILVEDVDSIKKIDKVVELLKESKSPIILTTSDYGSRRLSTVKKLSKAVQLRKSLPASIAKYLEGVCRKEGVEVDKKVLMMLAKNSSGDIRAALNDLETLAKGRESVGEEDLEVLGFRDKRSDIYSALSRIFGAKDIRNSVEATRDLDEMPRDVLLWIDENTPHVYTTRSSLRKAFYYLSRADVFLGRIMRRQYWGFLRYVNSLMTAGVSVSREKVKFTRYQFPSYIISLSKSRTERNLVESISGKISPALHVSKRVFLREYVPLFRTLLRRKRLDEERFAQKFDLSSEELEYLKA